MAYMLSNCIKEKSIFNPEVLSMIKGYVKINGVICKGCELCIISCPQDGLRLSSQFNEKGYRFVELIEDKCTGCVNCALVCPEAAITVYRQPKQVKKVVAKE